MDSQSTTFSSAGALDVIGGLPTGRFRDSIAQKIPFPIPRTLLDRFLTLRALDNIWRGVQAGSGALFHRLLAVLQIECSVSIAANEPIPPNGATIVVANHPFGLLDGPLLGRMVESVRSDLKFLANDLLADIPGLEKYLIAINPFENKSVTSNARALREAVRWLLRGGLLVVFPAGEVSSFDMSKGRVSDPPWTNLVARLARRTHAKVVPVFIRGRNSLSFQAVGLIHNALRTLLLPRELLNKRKTNVAITVGRAIAPEHISRFISDSEATNYLRGRTYLLQTRISDHIPGNRRVVPVAASTPADSMESEVNELPPDARLLSSGVLFVYIAQGSRIPNVLREIARLREISFRKEAEGTGAAIDLDHFDDYYLHLFLWNAANREIVGAYRFTPVDAVRQRFGYSGLYTTTLFHFPTQWWETITPAIELGRSFVRIEYQRSYQALFLLWKGIGAYVQRYPQYRYLFGPVSISDKYPTAAKALLITHLQRHFSTDVPQLVRPVNAFRMPSNSDEDWNAVRSFSHSQQELNDLLSDLHPQQEGVPVLLRQYLKLGGGVLSFNVDTHFSDAVDALLLLDLTRAEPRLLGHYFGDALVEKLREGRSLDPAMT